MIDLALGAKWGSPSKGGWTVPLRTGAPKEGLEIEDAPMAARAIGPMLKED
jgi:hypothetical protein